jgi:ABC-2 type transport system ATP-binding protein
MAISVEHFGRTYTTATGTVPAVDDLSFQVSAGEIVGLIGPNGAGKTTTLRALAGILKPTSGHVRIDGYDLIAEPIEAKRRLAFMPDEPHLFEYLTVAEHLRLVARLYAVEDFERRSRACGLVRSATTLLFDEPLTGLDPLGIRRMRETIASRAREGAAILLSSHLLHLVEEVCTRVLIMDRGRKVADGTFDELRARAELAQAGSSLEQIFLCVTGHDTPAERS